MGNTFFFSWEVSLIEWLQAHLGEFGELLAKGFSTLGGSTVILAVVMIVYLAFRKEAGKRVGLATLLSAMFFSQIKGIICRRRPYMDHPSIRNLQSVDSSADPMNITAQGYSMPSGHCAMGAASYGDIGLQMKKKWLNILMWVLVLFIGISRFCVGVHYPTDVLCGFAIGILCILFEGLIRRFVRKEWVRYLIYLLISVPGLFWCRTNDYFTGLGAMIGMAAGFLFDSRYVRFEDTKNWLFRLIRAAGAGLIYFALNTLLKLPFSSAFLNSGTLGAGLVRSARYAVILFIICGIWPAIFTKIEKNLIKNNKLLKVLPAPEYACIFVYLSSFFCTYACRHRRATDTGKTVTLLVFQGE
ncbi:MAG: hypothetical protein CW338_06820 [Clostridiales bacterium]|nr:hypothetical protein [Clostridiales bacterium]